MYEILCYFDLSSQKFEFNFGWLDPVEISRNLAEISNISKLTFI